MNRIREYREKAGMMQKVLAKMVGIAQSEISRLERAGVTPTLPSRRAEIAAALGAPVAEIFPDPPGWNPTKPLRPRRELFKSSRYDGYVPAKPKPKRDGFEDGPAKPEPVPMTRTVCPWCGARYSPDREVRIMVGENVIKTYGHLSCLEQDVRTDGLDLKKRGIPR